MENLTLPKKREQLDKLKEQLASYKEHVLGYPLSGNIDFTEIYDFFKFPINNIGDPFEECNYRVQTTKLEKEVIDFFAKLFNANPNDYWGYVSSGGSESNLCAFYNARKLYPDAVVYYSDAAHYSVPKNIDILNMEFCVVNTLVNGEMDYEDLEKKLLLHKSSPAVISLNFGTTMTEAKDNIEKVKAKLALVGITKTYIHCDAALSGSYGAFISPRIPFDFSDGVDSICLSAHKFLGLPMPSGVFLTKKSIRDQILRPMAVIDSYDSTVNGSRNGHTPLFLWYLITKMGVKGIKKSYTDCLEVTNYCTEKLRGIGKECWVNLGGITIYFKETSTIMKQKWQLATVDGITHVICMPGITKAQIDLFIDDILKEELKFSELNTI